MHYVYLDGKPVPPEVAATVVKIPPGISSEHPLGGFFTFPAEGQAVQVTAIKDSAEGIGIAPAQDPKAFMKVDLTPELRDQLNRIESKLDGLKG